MQQKKNNFSLMIEKYTLRIAILLVDFIIAMILSKKLINCPAFGAAVYVSERVWMLYFQLFRRKSAVLPDSIKNKGVLIFLFSAIFSVLLLIVFPQTYADSNILILLGVLFLMLLWSTLLEFIILSAKKTRLAAAGIYTAIFVLVVALSGLTGDTSSKLAIVAGFSVSSLLAYAFSIITKDTAVDFSEESAFKAKKILRINAYNFYLKTVTNVLIATFIILFMFVFYLVNIPDVGIVEIIVGMAALSVSMHGIFLLINHLFKKKGLHDIDLNTLVVASSVLWILSGVASYNSLNTGNVLYQYILLLQGSIGAALLFSSIFHMNTNIRNLIVFSEGEIEDEIVMLNNRVIIEWAFMVGLMFILSVVTVLSFLSAEFQFEMSKGWTVANITKFAITLLPLVFIWLAMRLSLRQPLTLEYVKKLRKYFSLKKLGEECTALKNRLNMVLVKKYTRRYGIKILAFVLKLFVHHRIVGREKVNDREGSVVFVSNHGDIYGPIITNLYVPFFFRPWVICTMFDRQSVFKHTYKFTSSRMKWLPRLLQFALCKLIAPVVAWAIRSTNAIPVYRSNLRKLMKTFDLTMEALEEEDNILLFPENPNGMRYKNTGVGELYSGFAYLGSLYYKKTGKCITFYPLYASKKKRIISFGEGIKFKPNKSSRIERVRISKALYDSMNELMKQVD